MIQDGKNYQAENRKFLPAELTEFSVRGQPIDSDGNLTTGFNRKVSRMTQACAKIIKKKYSINQLKCYQAVFKSGSHKDITVTISSRRIILYANLGLEEGESLRLLKNNGIDVNHINHSQVNTGNKIPMIWAAERGYRNIVQALIKAGGNVNVRNDQGETPLCFAIFKNRLTVIKLLLEENIDWKYFKSYCHSASLNAISTGKLEVVKLLIEKGVYCSFKVNGWSALQWAEKSGQIHIAHEIKRSFYLVSEE